MIGSTNAPTSNITQRGIVKYGSLSNITTSGETVFAYIDDVDLSRYNYVIMTYLPEYASDNVYFWVLNIKTNRLEISIQEGYGKRIPGDFNLLYYDGKPTSGSNGYIYVDAKDNKLIFSATPRSEGARYRARVPQTIRFV